MDEKNRRVGLVIHVKNILLRPLEIIFSPTALRAYLSTLLAVFAALVLLGLAITAYVLFYWSYIPPIGFERAIHLQFDNVYRADDSRYDVAANPHGTVNLAGDVVSGQGYDVFVELSLPRTPDNRDAGNFMLEAVMYAPGSVVDDLKDTLVPGAAEADNQLARSRRPAILSYRSLVVEQLYKLTELHWYLLGWRQEADTLKIGLFEGVAFSRGWRNVPTTMTLSIQSTTRLQIYSAKASFRARFSGLRWVMYNHRIISAFVFTTAFWVTEMAFAAAAWAVLSVYLKPADPTKTEQLAETTSRVKQEDDDSEHKPMLSDTERTFPTSSKQQPLRYESPGIKQEDDEEAVMLPQHVSKATEADDEDDEDEDEDADVFLDSGLGTSMESSSSRRDSVRRRRGRVGPSDGVK